jgi:hypothetical protein
MMRKSCASNEDRVMRRRQGYWQKMTNIAGCSVASWASGLAASLAGTWAATQSLHEVKQPVFLSVNFHAF